MNNPEIISGALSGMGFVGAAIAALLMAIASLAGTIVILYRRNNSLNDERKDEIRAVIRMAEATTATLDRLAEINDDRNRVTEGLADAIKAQASVLELVTQRVDCHHVANLEKLKDMRDVVAAMAEAVRVHTGVSTAAREASVATQALLTEVKLLLAKRR